jgi:2-methylcitrate dehydratase PrpD
VVATCLLKGRFGLPELQPDALADARVRALAERVRCSVDPNSAFPTYFSGGVRVMLKDSREVFRHVRVNSGAGERALTQDEVVAKFMASASLAVDRGQAGRIRDVVLDLENRAVADLAVLGRAAS